MARVVVATDDDRILRAVRDAGFDAQMTDPNHPSGTDRVAEVARSLDCELVVNVQGDEPLISPDTIDAAVEALVLDGSLAIATTCEPLRMPDDLLNPNAVKVVMRSDGHALYFSRAPIPFPRDVGDWGTLDSESEIARVAKKHTGLYAYRRDALLQLASMKPSPLEKLERLEQLRALENGFAIGVVEVATSSIGVDDERDLQHVRSIWNSLRREGASPKP